MQKSQQRGRGRRTGLLIAGIVVLVLGGAWLTARAVYGPDFMKKAFASNEAAKDDHAGKVAVLVSPRPISAFTLLDPFALIDPTTGDYQVAWVSEKIANEDKMIRDPNQIRGRVLRRDKLPWRAFNEADLYPPGTQPGPTSALKPGQRGVTISPDDVEGLHVLRRFDRFDLFAVKSKANSSAPAPAGTFVDPSVQRQEEAAKGWSTDRMLIALNAEVLEPVPAPTPGAQAPRTLFAGMTTAEANALAIAIEKGAKIFCQPRTGQPGGDHTPIPKLEEPVEFDTIELFHGNKPTQVIVPATPDSK